MTEGAGSADRGPGTFDGLHSSTSLDSPLSASLDSPGSRERAGSAVSLASPFVPPKVAASLRSLVLLQFLDREGTPTSEAVAAVIDNEGSALLPAEHLVGAFRRRGFAPGGAILVDDFHNYGGSRTATEEFLRERQDFRFQDGDNVLLWKSGGM